MLEWIKTDSWNGHNPQERNDHFMPALRTSPRLRAALAVAVALLAEAPVMAI